MASFHWWSLCVLILWSGRGFAQSHQSNGVSGEPCGTDQRKCIDGMATCNLATGRCDCRDPHAYGNGMINCYPDNWFRAEVFNDPQVMTYNGNSIGLPIPCRYLLTHTETQLKDENHNVVGSCEFLVHAFHAKDNGKIFLFGYDVAIRISYNNGSTKLVSVRKKGKGWNAAYGIIITINDDVFEPNGPGSHGSFHYYDPNINLQLGCDIDPMNNLAILEVERCGIRVQFRPYDCGLRHASKQIPHLAYGVNGDFNPVFHSQNKVVAIPPAAHFGGKTIDDVLPPFLDREEALLLRALKSMAHQSSPFSNAECTRSVDVLNKCYSDAVLARGLHHCMFILKYPKFIKCYDPSWSGIKLMALFNDCVLIECNDDDCHDVEYDILHSGCVNYYTDKENYPGIIDFIDNCV